MEYGVNVANKFGSLSDDDVEDPSQLLAQADADLKRLEEQKKAEKRLAAKQKKVAPVPVKVEAPKPVEAPAAPAVRGGGRGRGESRGGAGRGRGEGREGGRGRGAPRPFGERGERPERSERPDVGSRFGEGGGGRGGRGGGGRGAARGGATTGTEHSVTFNENVEIKSGDERPRVFRGDGTGRGGRGGGRGGRGGGAATGEFSIERSERPEGERPFSGRGGRGGFGGGRGGGRGGTRDFDRVSGSDRTGVKSVDKKDGFGKGNWGTDADELAGETDKLDSSGDALAEGETREPPAPRELSAQEQAEAKMMTLEEFKAQQRQAEKPQFNIRRAGEGEKDDKNLVPMNKKEIADENAGEEEVVILKREPRNKVIDIAFQFVPLQSGDRGGRGRGRGDRRGGERRFDGEDRPHRGEDRPHRGEDRPHRGEDRPHRGGRGGRGGGSGARPMGSSTGNGANGRRLQAFDMNTDAFPALGAN